MTETQPKSDVCPVTTAGHSYRLYIDGAWTDGEGGDYTQVSNPATEEVIGQVAKATRGDVRRAIDAARRAFDHGPWPRMSVRSRAETMLQMVSVMERRMAEIIELNIAEAGSIRPIAETIQVGVPIAHFRDMAERVMLTFSWEKPLLPYVGAGIGQGVLRREPFGVAGLISAYNVPFMLSVMKLAPALAAGCTVVLKPAPTTPLESFLLADIADEVGLPPGVLNVVAGDADVGEEITGNPLVDLVSFTGSDTIGRMVYSQAAPTLKKVLLELGGKSANIICDDADHDLVVREVLMGMTLQAGQGCSLLTRTLVHRTRHDELVDKIIAALGQIKVGNPVEPDVTMGPLISAAQRDKVEKLIRIGEEEGARVVFGGGRPAGLEKGFFIEPTLFIGVHNSMAIARTEFFGPVGVVIPFDDDDDAVQLANDNPYGLAGSVWAKDPARAYRIAQEIRAGYVTINGGGDGPSPHVAFGGYKQSGLGREWGQHGLDEFLQTKSIAWGVASG